MASFRGSKGPGDCIFTVFSLGFSEALGVGQGEAQAVKPYPPGVVTGRFLGPGGRLQRGVLNKGLHHSVDNCTVD